MLLAGVDEAGRGPLAGICGGRPPGKKVSGNLMGPRRPPERLSQPSTRSLKKSVRTMRLEVMPPCECPASQKALMFSRPI